LTIYVLRLNCCVFTVICAYEIWLKFIGWLLRNLAEMYFCDLFRPHMTLTLSFIA